jgi:hypothetical protein
LHQQIASHAQQEKNRATSISRKNRIADVANLCQGLNNGQGLNLNLSQVATMGNMGSMLTGANCLTSSGGQLNMFGGMSQPQPQPWMSMGMQGMSNGMAHLMNGQQPFGQLQQQPLMQQMQHHSMQPQQMQQHSMQQPRMQMQQQSMQPQQSMQSFMPMQPQQSMQVQQQQAPMQQQQPPMQQQSQQLFQQEQNQSTGQNQQCNEDQEEAASFAVQSILGGPIENSQTQVQLVGQGGGVATANGHLGQQVRFYFVTCRHSQLHISFNGFVSCLFLAEHPSWQ